MQPAPQKIPKRFRECLVSPFGGPIGRVRIGLSAVRATQRPDQVACVPGHEYCDRRGTHDHDLISIEVPVNPQVIGCVLRKLVESPAPGI
jgi:hypothetical protein